MIFRSDKALAALAMLALAGAAGLAACSGQPDRGATQRISLATDPDFARRLEEAQRAMADGDLAAAGRKLDEARSLAPDNPDLWLAIARLRLRGGEHLSAMEAADRALAFGPNHAPALLLRGLMIRDAYGAPDALVWLAAARRADGDNPDVLAEYAATLGDSGQAGAMLRVVEKLADVAPDEPRVPWLRAVLAARGGEYTVARGLLTRSGMAARGVPAAMLLDAALNLEQGNAESAVQTLETLAARQPANARVRELLARALLDAGRENDVAARFGPEASLPEASPYLVMLVARAYERLGDRVAAAPLLARAYAPAPAAPVLLALRDGLPAPTAGVRRALWNKDAAGARQQAMALRTRLPASADVAVLAGDALFAADDPSEALIVWALASEVRRPWPVTRKAVWTFARHGNPAAAERLLTRQVAGEPETASAVTALARRQAARGDWRRTALLLDHALALGAGHDPALLALRERAAQEAGDGAMAARFAALLADVRPRSLATR